MKQLTLTEFEPDGVQCPECGKKYETYQAYAIHFAKSSDHNGEPALELVGRERFEHLHLTESLEDMAGITGLSTSTIGRLTDELDLPPKTNRNRLETIYGVPLEWLLDTLHNTLEKPASRMATELDVSRRYIERRMDELGIHRRGQSEAEKLKWEQMSPEEREAQVEAAHEKNRELAANGELAVQRWRRENPEKAREMSVKWASTLAERRDENGMKGVTGQDNPLWRGGKSVYDAVKKQLRPSFKTVKDEYRDDECAMCGEAAEDANRKLDVHHIIPLLSGGTNDEWNMTTLCRACHRKAEAYSRDIPELESVLIEE